MAQELLKEYSLSDEYGYARSTPATSPTSPIQVLIKDEIHEVVPYEITDDNVLLSPKSDTVVPCAQEPRSSNTANDDLLLGSDSLISSTEVTQISLNTDNVRSKRNKSTKASNIVSTEKSRIESDLYCKVCDICLRDKEHLEVHQSGHLNNLRCVLCTTVLKNFKNYEKHVGKCKPFECKLCGKSIRFRPNYIKHLRIHNPVNNTKNADDGESSVQQARKKIPKSERHKYKCTTCDKEFTSWEYFKVHQKIHVDNVNLKCNICKKTFSALACLRGHSKVHTGERPFRCDVCGKGFGQSYNLKIHSRLHSGEKPFACEVCGRRMNTTASYNAHKKTHKHYECQICSEHFNQKMKYMTHMGIHETGKVLECNICGKKFGRSSNFYNHQRIHLGIKKFKCYICSHAFVKAANLDAHLLIHCDDNNVPTTSTSNVNQTIGDGKKANNELLPDQEHAMDEQPNDNLVTASSLKSVPSAVTDDKTNREPQHLNFAHNSIFDESTNSQQFADDVDDDFLFDNSQQTYSSYDSMYSL